MSEEKLVKILDKGDEKKCLQFFRGMPEKERRGLAPFCLKRFRGLEKTVQPDPNTYMINPLLPAMSVAMPNVCNWTELKKLGTWGTPDQEMMFTILQDRRPEWIDRWVHAELERSRYWQSWPVIYRLVKAGLCEKPSHVNYFMGMITGLQESPRGKPADLKKRLRDDPDLLAHDIWKLFEHDGSTENSLAMCDGWEGKSSWGLTLCSLAKAGDISRAKLIDCTFDALQRDFNHYRAKWFQQLHDELKLTDSERSDRRDRYLGLLRCSTAPVVSWAYKEIEQLHKKSPYDADALMGGIEPVLHSRQKGIVKKALKLLKQTGTHSSAAQPMIAKTALVALAHEDAEVQGLALALIEQYGDRSDKSFVAAVSDHVPLVAASLRKQLNCWTQSGVTAAGKRTPPASVKSRRAGSAEKQIGNVDRNLALLAGATAMVEAIENAEPFVPVAPFDGMDIPRLADERKVDPITELDPLIDLCARVIEDGSRIEENEQVLDGISRLCDRRPDDFEQRVGPLKKRCVTLLRRSAPPFSTFSVVADLCGVIHSWITGDLVEAKKSKSGGLAFDYGPRERRYVNPDQQSPMMMLSRRNRSVAMRAGRQQSIPLLSAPTHAGGWICPRALVKRVNQWKGMAPDHDDVCLAMLRMAPDQRASALKALKTTKEEWSKAIKYALGASRMKIGTTAPLWLAAARARSPRHDDGAVQKALGNKEPDGAVAANFDYSIEFKRHSHNKQTFADLVVECQPKPAKKASSPVACFMPSSERANWEHRSGDPNATRWTASIWPQARESWCATGSEVLFDNLDWWEAQWRNKEFLEPLLDPDTPLPKMARLMLTLGLASKEPGEHGLAIDIVMAAIEDGRLGSESLGPALATLVPSGSVKAARLAKTLGEISRASPLHALVIQCSLQSAIRSNGKEPPKDLPKLMDLLKELSIEQGLAIGDEDCRNFLQEFSGSGKAAKLAKQLLDLQQSDDASHRVAQEQALQHRIERVKRWQQNL